MNDTPENVETLMNRQFSEEFNKNFHKLSLIILDGIYVIGDTRQSGRKARLKLFGR